MSQVELKSPLDAFIGENVSSSILQAGTFKLTIGDQTIGYDVFLCETDLKIGRFKEVDLDGKTAKTSPVTKQIQDFDISTIQLEEGEVFFTGGDAEKQIVQEQIQTFKAFTAQEETTELPKPRVTLSDTVAKEYKHMRDWVVNSLSPEKLKKTGDEAEKALIKATKDTEQAVVKAAQDVGKETTRATQQLVSLGKKKKWW